MAGRVFKSEFYNFEALRLLSFAPYEGCDIAEFMFTCGKIRDLDPESWFREWTKAGEKAEALADEAYAAGNVVEARRGYFRAASYQRAAQFMLNGRNPKADARILRNSEDAISNHRRALDLMEEKYIALDIPYEDGVRLPAYLHLPSEKNRLPGKTPIVVNVVGADATQEEIFFIQTLAGIRLGYAVLSFEGPGQGLVLRRDGLPMRPDWETVTSKVLNYLENYISQHPELDIDMTRLALTGSSAGGYLALRAAVDDRVKACVSVDPFYSMWDLLKGRMPDFIINTYEAGGFAADYVWDWFVDMLCYFDFQTRWEFNHLRWIYGKAAAFDVLGRMRDFTLARPGKDDRLKDIKCPVLVTGAAGSIYAKPAVSTVKIFDGLSHLGDKRSMWIATDMAEGGLQSKIGAFGLLTRKTYAWLDQQFGIVRHIE